MELDNNLENPSAATHTMTSIYIRCPMHNLDHKMDEREQVALDNP
jgi:hypothetical protein